MQCSSSVSRPSELLIRILVDCIVQLFHSRQMYNMAAGHFVAVSVRASPCMPLILIPAVQKYFIKESHSN